MDNILPEVTAASTHLARYREILTSILLRIKREEQTGFGQISVEPLPEAVIAELKRRGFRVTYFSKAQCGGEQIIVSW
jgi:hypothetical protein